MQLRYHTHNVTLDETAPQVRAALWELRAALSALPYFYWPEKSSKLNSTEGMSAQKEKQLRSQESLQSLNNIWLRQELQERGFEAECPVRDSRTTSDNQRVDFARLVEDDKRVMVEVEFGYTASIERNLLKLTDAYFHDRCALGILICPVASLAKATASGVANFETARERLQSMHPKTMPVPLVVIGLDHQDAERIDLSKSLLPDASCLSGNNSKEVLWHVASELRAGVCVDTIGLPGALERRVARREVKARSVQADKQARLFG